MPGKALPPERGNQLCVTPRYTINCDCIPNKNPATAVNPNEEKLPTSAAVKAGTIKAGIVAGSTAVLIDATKTPSSPVTTVDNVQFTPDKNSGENPKIIAPFSFSAAALVAKPNRVNRNNAQSARVKITTRTLTIS